MKQKVLLKLCLVVPFHGTVKNRKQIRFNRATKKPFIGKDDRHQVLENDLMRLFKQAGFNSPYAQNFPIKTHINAKFVFWFPRSRFFTAKGKRSMNVPDLSNLYELPQDVLTKSGLIDDDWYIDSHNGSCRAFHEESEDERYILEIELTEASNG